MASKGRDKSQVAGVIAPPPLIYLGFLAVGLTAGRIWPLPFVGAALPTVARVGLAVAVALAGVAIGIAGFRQFRRAGTQIRPDRPATALVTEGIYRRTRNPIYLGLALFYAAIAVGSDSLPALALLAPTLGVIRYGVIAREEAYLERRFGDDYRRFKARVRRWL